MPSPSQEIETSTPAKFASLMLLAALTVTLIAADDARFNTVGHKMICGCGCNQILLECNHVGCPRSDGMRKELLAAIVGRGGPGGGPDDESGGGTGPGSKSGPADNSDNAILQSFVDRYGPTILAAP